MRSIFKWFALLLTIIFCALLLFQNHAVLFESKDLSLITEDVFGFTFGTIQMPLIVYFGLCILIGALFMALPAMGLWIKARRLKNELGAMMEEQLEDTEPDKADEAGDDLVYHIKEDEEAY